MIILPYGDSALLVNFEQTIEPKVNKHVIGLNHMLSQLPQVTFTIPAYCSLTVGFDQSEIDFTTLKDEITRLSKERRSKTLKKGLLYTIPVCYEGEFAPDMDEVCALTGLSNNEVMQLHTTTTFRVYMLGFIAGFAYLGSLPEALYCSRKHTPRSHVPEGAIGLAGHQTGIYPTQAPGGWQLIGQTPVKTFDPKKAQPALLQPGDQVRFKAITIGEYQNIKSLVNSGIYEMEVRHV